MPPPSISTSMRDAPASRAFSTSSLTTEAGRSTTSPAAIRSMTSPESRWILVKRASRGHLEKHDLSADDGHATAIVSTIWSGGPERMSRGEDDEVGELAGGERALLLLLERGVGRARRVGAERLLDA